MDFPVGFSYKILAARLGLKDFAGELNIEEAKRTWQLWGSAQDYRFSDENGDEDRNVEIAFGRESGLAVSTVRERVKACKEFQALIDLAAQ